MPLDINQVYKKCMSGTPNYMITARTVYNYCVSPFMVYCDQFGPEEKKDPLNEYDKMLFEQGKTHEKEVLASAYPGLKPVKYDSLEEGFKLLLTEMQKSVSILCGLPGFYKPEGLNGIFDVLEKHTGQKSVFGNYFYVVKEIKLSRNIQNTHVFQTAFYNYLLGKIQGYTPETFYIINRDKQETEHAYNEAELIKKISDIREILNGKKVNPTYGACCWPWETFNNEEAIKTRDISLVSGVGSSFKQKLVEKNLFTVEDLAKASLDNLTSIKGIGEKTANKFLHNSRALVWGKHTCLGACDFPQRTVEIFLDLEGTGEQVQEEELVAIDYLIGVIVRSNGKAEYIPFVAHTLQDEKAMFQEFLNWVLSQDDYIIYHWHNYEKVHIQRLIDRYGLSKEAQPILANMRDLYKDATANFAFPTYGNGLKQVAAYIGYKWKHADVNAMESIALYFQYIQDPTKNKEKLEKVIDYNQDDCTATMLIKDWMEHESKNNMQ
ncbi:MAG: TM0106 family RecB-like putative nuclease [Candidatus Bathyarchaeia archaeon]|jgi:predicted RecB family nuclease